MQARELLMIEHRLIEGMIVIIKRTLSKIEKDKKVNPVLVDTAVDFIRTCAAQCFLMCAKQQKQMKEKFV